MATKTDLLTGQLAVDREYITGKQLADALSKQAELSEVGMEQDLLQVLFTKGYVSADQAKELRAEVGKKSVPAPADPLKRPASRAGKPSRPALARPAKDARSRGAARSRPPAAPRPRVRQGPDAAYPEPKKPHQGVVVGIVGGAVVLMAVVVAFFASNGEKKPTAEEEKGAPKRQPVKATTAPPVAPGAAVVPPDDVDEGLSASPKDLVPPGDEAKNVLPNGALDEVRGGWFRYWKVKNGGVRVTLDRKRGNAWCEIPEGGGYLEQRLGLDPTWAELRVSAVMRCKGLEFGDGPDDTFRVALEFQDAEGTDLGSPEEVPELIEDAQWVDLRVTFPVPREKNPRYLVLRAGNFGSAGVCGIDEIRVIPSKIDERPAGPGQAAWDEDLPVEEAGAAAEEPAGVVAPVDDPSEIAYWNFDEGGGTIAGDSSGQGRHGMVLGAKWTAGRRGGALGFDGRQAYVEIPGADDTVRSSYAVCAWIRPADGQQEEKASVVSKGATRLVYGRGGKISAVHVLEGEGGRDEAVEVACRGTYPPGRWYHVAMVVAAENATAAVYVDGAEAGSKRWGDPDRAGKRIRQNWTIGMLSGEREAYKGAIDEVRIYARALTAEEVRLLVAAESEGPAPARRASAPAPAHAPASAPAAGAQQVLDDFLALVLKGEHAMAGELAKEAAKNPDNAADAARFRSLERVARAFGRRRVHAQRNVIVMAGVKRTIQTVNGPREGKIRSTTDEAIELASEIVINRKVVGQTAVLVSWTELTREQMAEFAAGWKPENADDHIALAILAATSEPKDMEAIADALDGAGDHPLIDWVIGLTEE